MPLSRRRLIQLGGVAAAVPLVGCDRIGDQVGESLGTRSGSSTGSRMSSQLDLPEPFQVPLPRPRVLEPTNSDGTTDFYEVTQRAAKVEIVPGHQTEIWGYDGTFPGPTIESRAGRRTVVRHRNELPVPVVVHLHGGKNPAEHDGYPIDYLLPTGGFAHGDGMPGHTMAGGNTSQGTKDYVYPLDQPAATLWYHDHRMDFTGPQVYRGLAGFHLVRDDEEDALPLPKGEKEVPLFICDRAFAEDGSFRYPAVDHSLHDPGVTGQFSNGVLGDVILVNGAPWPTLDVANTRYRFRVLNGSNARRYALSLDPKPGEGRSFVQIGSDAGLLGAPIGHDRIEIAPAERYDLVVDFSQFKVGTRVTLRNEFDNGRLGSVMQFHVARKATEDSTVPGRLADFEQLDRSMAVRTRQFLFGQGVSGGRQIWAVNGKPFEPDRIDAQPKLGSVEIWKLVTDVHHPVHLHLAHFQVLSRMTQAPLARDAGWKDTVDILPGQIVEVLAKFTGHRGKYVFHCHNLEHEDMVMMSNLEVV
ncbi:multicopper oxidase family protein [Micromonospora sp. WMMD882]|uniref:multicopper oxidase family protein n=1 Tax=Micromonospora sp. WMMD882 TaxID=3015151 RepID=UPI00248CBDDD|nr:multicopper oxidase family protein [Micromonospora sp. WMMD882]WBB81491.1 multicopper oxidase family protein [Micromonospora sp. WMMD882]